MKEPVFFDTSDGQQLRINMISPWLKRYFTEQTDAESNENDSRTLKVVKLSLDGGFTCPNRDGTKGTGGCKFCSESGSGDMASRLRSKGNRVTDTEHGKEFDADSIRDAIRSQMELLSDKWPAEKYKLKYIAYFQNHTNTYGSVEKLRNLFETAIEQEGICGIAIATRPDCISQETLKLLDELNQKTFLWVELGLQTIHDDTAKAMNLCHKLEDYDRTVKALKERNIRVVTHLILGLPGETREMMLDSVRYACRDVAEFSPEEYGEKNRKIFGIKLHMLNIVKGSAMEKEYSDYLPFETMEDYIDLLVEALEIIPREITLHRISGDAPRTTLIAPAWSYKKRTILNSIHATMKERNLWQGRRSE